MIVERRTVTEDIAFEGRGLHSGEPVRIVVRPGSEGIWFRDGQSRVEAIPGNVTDTTRCTRLGSVSTIEHLMGALAGREVTDAEIEVTGGEIPGLDGSAKTLFDGITPGEVIGCRELPSLFTRIFLQEDSGLKMAVSKGTGHWRYVYDLGQRWPGSQSFELEHLPFEFGDQVASARTLVLTEEIEGAKSLGLGRGLDDSSVLIVGREGYLNESRFPDEPARHKLLDLIGDLYLAGIPLKFLNVAAEKSGHRANVQVAKMLKNSLAA
ncbi:MAG TPA: UDP-3-O-acyl-N-acetylglucosamine deacetylase [Fimbriimonas sp.]|nr:UDP-3-O-acyl-N-acetylglucosamine deacetylase [Fimbriimonas sp.]